MQYPNHIYTKSLKKNVTTKAKFTEHLRKKLTPFWKHTCTAKHQAWAFYTMIGNLEDGQEILLIKVHNFAIAAQKFTMLCLKGRNKFKPLAFRSNARRALGRHQTTLLSLCGTRKRRVVKFGRRRTVLFQIMASIPIRLPLIAY